MIGITLSRKSEPLKKIDESAIGQFINNNFQSSSNNLKKTVDKVILSDLDFTTYPYPSTAVAVQIVSTSVNDDVLGSGAQEITVVGLDVNRDMLIEVVDMDGTTPVVLSALFLRVNKLIVTGSDPRGINEGSITLSTTVGGNALAFMRAGAGQSFDGILGTPRNIPISIYIIDVTARKGDSGEISFFRSTEDGPMIQRTADISYYGNNFSREFIGPILVPAESDIELRASSTNEGALLSVTSQLVQLGSPPGIGTAGF